MSDTNSTSTVESKRNREKSIVNGGENILTNWDEETIDQTRIKSTWAETIFGAFTCGLYPMIKRAMIEKQKSSTRKWPRDINVTNESSFNGKSILKEPAIELMELPLQEKFFNNCENDGVMRKKLDDPLRKDYALKGEKEVGLYGVYNMKKSKGQ